MLERACRAKRTIRVVVARHDGDPGLIACSECGRAPRPGENPDDEWRVESDGVGGLHVFCPACHKREVGSS